MEASETKIEETKFNPSECNLKYEDQDGKIWLMKRTKNPRSFTREDGKKLSHTHVLFNYDYRGRAFYKESKNKVRASVKENEEN